MDCFEQKIRITKKDYRIISNIINQWLNFEEQDGYKSNLEVDKLQNGRITILQKYFTDKGI